MAMTSIGDMSLHFQSLRHGVQVKTRLATLTQELGTGLAADLTAHLGGDRTRFTDIERRLSQVEGYSRAANETGQVIGVMQVTLSAIDGTRNALAEQLLMIGSHTAPQQLDNAVLAGRSAFDSISGALNTSFGAQNLFSGTATDSRALAAPDLMRASIAAATAAATTAADVRTAIDTWFDSPTGGFATLGYLGDTGPALTRRIDAQLDVMIDARANDPALRDVLKATAMAAIAGDPGLALAPGEKAALLLDAGVALLSAGQPLVAVQARLGQTELQIEVASASISARQTAYGIIHNELISVDPYTTATALQQVQAQLETHYTLTSRLSRLTLMEYLR